MPLDVICNSEIAARPSSLVLMSHFTIPAPEEVLLRREMFACSKLGCGRKDLVWRVGMVAGSEVFKWHCGEFSEKWEKKKIVRVQRGSSKWLRNSDFLYNSRGNENDTEGHSLPVLFHFWRRRTRVSAWRPKRKPTINHYSTFTLNNIKAVHNFFYPPKKLMFISSVMQLIQLFISFFAKLQRWMVSYLTSLWESDSNHLDCCYLCPYIMSKPIRGKHERGRTSANRRIMF